jgi:long-chain acyl-CoA synthetase
LAALASSGRAPVGSPRDREALAVLLYTAGTSGQPQAAMLTHRALLAHLEHLNAVGVLDAETHVLAILPLFHVFGLNAVLGSWVFAGGRLVVMDGLTEDFFEVVRAEQITNLPLAPAIVARLCQDDRLADGLVGVRTVVSGAAPLPKELQVDFTRRTGLRIEQGYGLTEAAPGVSATFGGDLRDLGHVGRPLPGVEVRIADGSDPSEPGVIWIRGDNLFSGYWPDGRDGPGPDGWFSTGDIGYLNAGELYLVDRARELVIVNGFNVFPAEVEQVIAEIPGVAEVAVIGHPDPRTGEQVVAFVVGTASADEIRQRCATQLAKFKRPVQVRVVPELPRGATGKVLKGALRNILGVDDVPAP